MKNNENRISSKQNEGDYLCELADLFFKNVLYNSRTLGKKEFTMLYNILKKYSSKPIYRPTEYYITYKFKKIPLQKCIDEAYYIANLKYYGKDNLFNHRYEALLAKLSGDIALTEEVKKIVGGKNECN